MKVSLWAEIRRLHEVEGLSRRAIAARMHCSRSTVDKALAMPQPPSPSASATRESALDPYKPKIDALLANWPELSAVRIWEEIRRGPDGYQGSVITVRRYVRKVRPSRGRVYQEVVWEPGQAMQVDWGQCGQLKIGTTSRQVSVFVAVLCYSRLCYIEFTLSQRKAEFYRAIVQALEFYGGSPRRIIFDNLKAAVLNGSGRHACLHPEFLALCGHFCLEPIACARRDPQSKGIVESGVRYVKRNALEGRADQLTCWADYRQLAVSWRDEVANRRIHQTTRERPLDRFQQERPCLRALPSSRFDTDEIVTAIVTSHARIQFDGNRYSVPPEVARKPVMIRASTEQVRVIYEGREIACHRRSYDRRQLIIQPDHQLQVLRLRRSSRGRELEEAFDALGEVAREFHLKLRTRPVKTTHHLRRLLNLVRVYGRSDVLAAIARAHHYQTYDAAYVETILLQERRRRELPSPTPLRPKRQELIEEIELEDPDPAIYDRFLDTDESEPKDHDQT
jgi:transposase